MNFTERRIAHEAALEASLQQKLHAANLAQNERKKKIEELWESRREEFTGIVEAILKVGDDLFPCGVNHFMVLQAGEAPFDFTDRSLEWEAIRESLKQSGYTVSESKPWKHAVGVPAITFAGLKASDSVDWYRTIGYRYFTVGLKPRTRV
jgi:hypothetical protein